MGCLGFMVEVSASYRYITSFGKLIHKLRHTSFEIVDLRTSGPESYVDSNSDSMIHAAVCQWQHNVAGLPVVDIVVDSHLSSHLRPHQRDGVIFLYQCVMAMKPYRGSGVILA